MSRRLPLLLLLVCLSLPAHPMGNFSISHYARFEAKQDGVGMVYALDLAEIPSFELLRDWQVKLSTTTAVFAHPLPHGRGSVSEPRASASGLTQALQTPELETKALEQARRWVSNLAIQVDGRPAAPRVESANLFIAGGAANLPVLRLTAQVTVPVKPGRLSYEDRNYPERGGWKEIVIAAGEDVRLYRATHTAEDRSKALSAYPEDPAVTPPQDVRAQFDWQPLIAQVVSPRSADVVQPIEQPASSGPQASPAAQAPTPGTVQKGDFLSQLLSKQDLSLAAILIGLAAAFGLGAMHALSPGHGKTIVAAYLVGSRGTFGHAMFLGGMVTFTHTISVFLLGLGTLFLSRYVVPDKIYPILGTISGLTIVLIGASLFYQRLRRLMDIQHHAHDHHHGHHDHHHDHPHGPGSHSHAVEGEVTMGSLVGLAVSGGLVPCPSALVLLLSSIAIGRVGLGLLLLTTFSLGLSLVLIAIGCAVLFAKNLLPSTPRVTSSPFFTMLPVVSAAIITCVGLVMTAVATGLVKPGWG